MHSCETVPAPPATGPSLLLQLGRLIVRARSSSPHRPAPPPSTRDRLLHAKLLASKPSTSHQVVVQPKVEEEPKNESALEEQLSNHVLALWNEQIPVCIEVLLAPDCKECYTSLMRTEGEGSYDKMHCQQRALLLERWTMRALTNKGHESPAMISPQWLLNAVRSQLHFSQLSAWISRLKNAACDHNPNERRRKLSREMCNIKKLEANCDDNEDHLPEETRKLNIVYSIKIPGESYKMAEFTKPPNDHTFPITDIGRDVYLKMVVESLPRTEEIPAVFCTCRRRKTSKETVVVAPAQEDLVVKLNDLTIAPNTFTTDPKAINSNTGPGCSKYYQDEQHECSKVLDDRMHTSCNENGKHKCNCDEESDGKEQSTSNNSLSEPKNLDERRLKEIAKYKRRLRKESKLKKLSDSTSSEGDGMQKTYHPTSIPILQAARFDRLRAIGCYRNQTYLTLPATRIESKSPFAETISLPPKEEYQKKTSSSVGTQTENLSCQCGNPLQMSCEGCNDRGTVMVRSEATYDLASIYKNRAKTDETGARRKREDVQTSSKKHKCDNNISSNKKCDIQSLDDNLDDSFNDGFIKRPKLRRFFAIEDRLERVAMDRRNSAKDQDQDRSDAQILNLESDDTVFSKPANTKRQKTVSIDDDEYVLYEKCCDFGSFDKCDTESPKDVDRGEFKFPDPRRDGQENPVPVPSPTEMDRFRWRFDSAASMVFHTKTGLPLTSSPAPLRRGNNCFDFDDSINGISGIKSALFHPISPPSPSATPASPPATFVPRSRSPPARSPRPHRQNKLKIGPTTGLLGSFEESALKGRLEPVATVHGFTAELGASGAFCPPHKKLPVTVFFYAPGGTNAPYMGHIALGPGGYRVPRSGTVQVSLLNPHGTLVKMFVVLYELTGMPPLTRTFLRQRTLYMPAGGTSARPPPAALHKWLRYLIHLRFMTSKSGKLYLHTDIRILVSRKADLDTATAHSAIFKPIPTNQSADATDEQASSTNQNAANPTDRNAPSPTNQNAPNPTNRAPNRVFGGCGEFDAEFRNEMREIGYENQNGVSYELRSFTYAPENPKYSPR